MAPIVASMTPIEAIDDNNRRSDDTDQGIDDNNRRSDDTDRGSDDIDRGIDATEHWPLTCSTDS